MIKIVVMFLLLMLAASMVASFVTKFLRGPPAPPAQGSSRQMLSLGVRGPPWVDCRHMACTASGVQIGPAGTTR